MLAEFQYDKDAKVKMLHKSILASRQSGKVLNSKLNARLVQITFKQCNAMELVKVVEVSLKVRSN